MAIGRSWFGADLSSIKCLQVLLENLQITGRLSLSPGEEQGSLGLRVVAFVGSDSLWFKHLVLISQLCATVWLLTRRCASEAEPMSILSFCGLCVLVGVCLGHILSSSFSLAAIWKISDRLNLCSLPIICCYLVSML